MTVTAGSLITQPTNPTRSGYVFMGWYKESSYQNEWNFLTDKVNDNIILYAKWEPITEYSVTFHLGYTEENQITVTTVNGKVTEPINPTRTGYDFNGWWISNNGGVTLLTPWNFLNTVTNDMVLYADWVEKATNPGQLRAPALEVDPDTFAISWPVIALSSGYEISLLAPGASQYITIQEKFNGTYYDLSGYFYEPGQYRIGVRARGDVLSGMVLSFLGQGADAFSACCCAVYLHGLAGDITASEKTEFAMTPSDILEYLPLAFKEVLK